jgi:polyhydroxybutyrate depolymerase
MIMFQGLADRMVPYNGGSTWISPGYFPSIRGWAAKWAKRNHCDPAPTESKVAADVILREYNGCADDTIVDLYTIIDGGHTWPGGQPLPRWFCGRTTNSINATQLMWKFFQQHPLHR